MHSEPGMLYRGFSAMKLYGSGIRCTAPHMFYPSKHSHGNEYIANTQKWEGECK